MEYFYGKMGIAINYGVDVAIFIENIRYWMETNAKIRENFIDGRYWIFYSLDGFSAMYPIWSRDQVKRIILKCKDAGLLLTADYNDNPYKRTKWYSLSDSALEFYGVTVTEDGIWRDRHIEKCKNATSTGRNRNIEEAKPQNVHMAKPPNVIEEKGEKKEENNTPQSPPEGGTAGKRKRKGRASKEAPDWKPERFEGFWRMYPLKKSKQAAIRAWDLLHPDDKLLAVMGHALQRQLDSREWQRKLREEGGQGIPYPATWINGRRWEDEAQPTKAEAASRMPAPERYGWD